jgi:CBS domain-containing protein
MLSSHHIHCLVVTSPSEHGAVPPWGLISAADLVRAASDGAGGSFEERTAAELEVGTPPTVSSADHLEYAAKLMAEQWTEHLIVAGAEDGRPAGLLSALDIAGVLAWGEA